MPLSLDEPEDSRNQLYPKEIINHLLLVWAIEYIAHSPTRFTLYDDEGKAVTPCDAILVDVVDLDQYDENGVAGLLGRKSWWRQGRLIQTLKPRVGRPNPILVKMTKTGQAFEISSMSADPASVARANNWYAANPNFVPSAVYVDDRPKQEEAAPAQRSMPLPPERPTETPLEAAARNSLNPAQQEAMDRLKRISHGPQFGNDSDIPF